MKKAVLFFLLSVFSLALAEDRFNSYSVNYAITYSAPDAITIQQNTGTKFAQFQTLTVYSSNAGDTDIQIERDGTAASATTQAINAMAVGEPVSTLTAWHGSNVGTGTVIYQFHIPAGSTMTFDISALRLPAFQYGGVRSNVTFRITSAQLPAVRMLPVWYEENL